MDFYALGCWVSMGFQGRSLKQSVAVPVPNNNFCVLKHNNISLKTQIPIKSFYSLVELIVY